MSIRAATTAALVFATACGVASSVPPPTSNTLLDSPVPVDIADTSGIETSGDAVNFGPEAQGTLDSSREWWPNCEAKLGQISAPSDWSVDFDGTTALFFRSGTHSGGSLEAFDFRLCGPNGQAGRLRTQWDSFVFACNTKAECLFWSPWAKPIEGQLAWDTWLQGATLAGKDSKQWRVDLAGSGVAKLGCSPLTVDFSAWSALACVRSDGKGGYEYRLRRIRQDGVGEPIELPNGWTANSMSWSDRTFVDHRIVLANVGHGDVIMRVAPNESPPVKVQSPVLERSKQDSWISEESEADLWIWSGNWWGGAATLRATRVHGGMSRTFMFSQQPNFPEDCASMDYVQKLGAICTGDRSYRGRFVVTTHRLPPPGDSIDNRWCAFDAVSGANWCRGDPGVRVLMAQRNGLGFLVGRYALQVGGLKYQVAQTDFFGNKSDVESGPCATMAMADCGDTNPCTSDRCDAAHGGCWHEPMTDGLPCGAGQACSGGTCM